MEITFLKKLFSALILAIFAVNFLFSTGKSVAFAANNEQEYRALLTQACNLYESRNYQAAITALQKSVQLTSSYKNLGDSYALIGVCYFQLSNYELAVENCQKAVKYQPLNLLAYSTMGGCYYESKNYDEAIKFFNKSLAIDPNDIDLYQMLSDCYLLKKNWQGVIDTATQYLSNHPKSPKEVIHLYHKRGVAYHMSDHGTEAVKDFKMAISLSKTYGISLSKEIIIELGMVLYNLKDLQTDSEYRATLKEIGITPAEAEKYIMDAEKTGKKFYS